MSASPLFKAPLAATMLLLAGCLSIDPASLTPATDGAALSAPAKGTTKTVNLSGTVSTAAGPVTTPNAIVKVVSVTPNNPFERTILVTNGTYRILGVPTSVQYAIAAVVPGQKTKVRVETLLSTSAPERVFNFGGRYDAHDPPGDSYVVGTEWCKEDAAEQVAASLVGAYRTLADIPIFTAQPLDTPTPTPTATPQTGTIPAHSASPIAVFTAQPVTPCVAHPIRARGEAGIEETPQQGPVQPRLVGTWKTAIPGAAWTGSKGESNVSLGAGLGDLVIRADGSCDWAGRRGKLRQVMPYNDAVPDTAYWLIQDPDGKPHYCAADGTGQLLFFLPGSNSFIAQGTRAP